MKAIRVYEYGGADVLKYEEVPDLIPAAGQILIAINAIGVNPVDTYIRSGLNYKADFPYTPGWDASGTVAAVGQEVRTVSPGDRVYTAGSVTGTYASQCLCLEHQVFPLPDHLSFKEGAALGTPFGTAYRALFQKGAVTRGHLVLIHGASGGVGSASLLLAKYAGAVVLATAGSLKGKELLERLGADRVFDHRMEGYLAEIFSQTGNRGVDVVIEMLANKNLGNDLSLLAPHGRIVVVGSRATVEINPREAMSREALILGMSLLRLSALELTEIHTALAKIFNETRMRPILGQEFPLAMADLAHEALLRPGAYGKIVLVPEIRP